MTINDLLSVKGILQLSNKKVAFVNGLSQIYKTLVNDLLTIDEVEGVDGVLGSNNLNNYHVVIRKPTRKMIILALHNGH